MTSPDLEGRLRRALSARPLRTGELPPGRPAGVLLMLFERDGEPWLVFTRRTHHVAHHKGQISFPGGGREDADADLEATAIRETVEELGIDRNDITIVGRLDDMPTFVTGYNVAPYVAVVPEQHAYHPSDIEIDEVIELPVEELARVGRRETIMRSGFPIDTNVFETRGHYIWGFTAAVLRVFLDDIWSSVRGAASE